MEVSKASPCNYGHNLGGDMEAVRRYVASRYPRLLDYSAYHCSIAGITDEAGDVLNEVMVSLFEKDPEKLTKMYLVRQSGYTQLDWFILQMVKINVHSPTSPYRYKNRKTLVNDNVDYRRLKVVEEQDEEPDRAGVILKQMKLIRYVFNGLDLSELERKAFDYKFFQDEAFTQWPGPEKLKQLYAIYDLIAGAIHGILYYEGLTKIKPKKYRLTGPQMDRQMEIIQQFRKTRRITIRHTNEYSQQN